MDIRALRGYRLPVSSDGMSDKSVLPATSPTLCLCGLSALGGDLLMNNPGYRTCGGDWVWLRAAEPLKPAGFS